MNACKCHYCKEGEKGDILVVVFFRFCRFWKRAFSLESPISTGRNGRLRPGKLLNLTALIGSKTRQFPYYCFDIQGASFFIR